MATGIKRLPSPKEKCIKPPDKKIERQYQWIQDHIARRCMGYKITDIKDGQKLLTTKRLKNTFNYRRSSLLQISKRLKRGQQSLA
jgi:hypothetical protein